MLRESMHVKTNKCDKMLKVKDFIASDRSITNQWRNHAWAIVVNDQVALLTDQVALPLDSIKQFM